MIDGVESVQITWDGQQPLWLEPAISSDRQKYTISGTPSSINEDTTYNYTLTAYSQVNPCESEEFTGSITVLNGHDLSLISSPSTTSQSFCEGDSLPEPIRYQFGGGASSARLLTGLPNGMSWDILPGNILEISGTPTINIDSSIPSANTFPYTVQTVGSGICSEVTLSGTITLVPEPVIQVSTVPGNGSSNQTICEGIALNPIEFNVIDGADSVQITWDGQEPLWVTSTSLIGQKYTISGTPNNIDGDTTYNYTLIAYNQAIVVFQKSLRE